MNFLSACSMAAARGLGLSAGWGVGIAIAVLLLQALVPGLPRTSVAEVERLLGWLTAPELAKPPEPALPPLAGPSLQDVIDACRGATS